MTAIVVLGAACLTVVVVAVALRVWVRVPAAPPPAPGELVGTLATVTIMIPPDGVGEVAVTTRGQRVKLSASAEAAVAAGATVVILDAASPDAVVVAESGF